MYTCGICIQSILDYEEFVRYGKVQRQIKGWVTRVCRVSGINVNCVYLHVLETKCTDREEIRHLSMRRKIGVTDYTRSVFLTYESFPNTLPTYLIV